MADDTIDDRRDEQGVNGAELSNSDDLGSAVADDFEAAGDLDEASEEAFAGEEEMPPSTGLLSFYDRLRERILRSVAGKSGRLGHGTVKVLLVVPDIFILLVRLVLDRQVPSQTRALLGGALAYFLLPVDLLPEALLGAAGYVDDAVLAAAVLSNVFGPELEPFVRKHWSGSEDIRKVLKDISGAARALLGESVYERLRQLLKKRGVEIDEQQRQPV